MSRLDELIRELCPDGVEYKALSDVCQLITGATPSKANKAYWENGTIPWMSSGEVNLKRVTETEQKITQLGYDKTSTKLVPKHSIVIALAGQGKTRGKVAITEIELCTNQSLCSIICKDCLDYKFLYYYLDGKYEELRTISNGDGTRGGLSLKILAPYKIPVPPLELQHEVVRILDNFTELTDELTAKLTSELTARQKQYEFYRDKLLDFGVLGGGTSECVWKTLAEIADISTGSSNTNEAVDDGIYPFYVRSQEPLRKNDYEYDEAAIITAGDGVGVGKVFHFVEGKYALHQRAYRIHINTPAVLPRYYFHYMRSAFLPYIQKTMFQGSVASIRRPMLNQFPVPIPPVQVQERLVNVLDNFETICSDLNIGLPAEIEARQKQYEYYRDMLLTFAESGNTISRAEQSRAEQSRAEQSRAL